MMKSSETVFRCFILFLLFPHIAEAAYCITCTKDLNAPSTPTCPVNEARLSPEVVSQCTGFCFYRTVASNERLYIRGCSASLTGLPSVLPTSGCYNWEGATFCFCLVSFCNTGPMKNSSGLSLDYLVHNTTNSGSDTTTTTATVTTTSTTAATTTTPTTETTTTSTTATTTSSTTATTTSSTTATTTPSTTSTTTPSTTATTISSTVITSTPTTATTTSSTVITSTPTTATTTSSTVITSTPTAATTQTSKDTSTVASTKLPSTTRDPDLNIKCADCRNIHNNTRYDWCPKDGNVTMGQAYFGDCKGPCFTRSDSQNSELVVRGCTVGQGTLPSPLPSDGCYDWNDATYCICSTSQCNKGPLGNSSGVELDAHLENVDPGDVGGPLQCFQCTNDVKEAIFAALCPKDKKVNYQTAYRENCSGVCFTRSYKNNSTLVSRGCTGSLKELPAPLPPSGCYSWDGETWCICNTSRCNGGPIGVSSGKELDSYLEEISENYVEPDGIKKCYQCVSEDNGKPVPQCPKDSRVKNAFLAPCNGSCITRTFADNFNRVARGCSSDQGTLPNPLPEDGCYPWFTERWCKCSGSRCNGAALGKQNKNVEFDAHLHKGCGSIKANRSLFAVQCLVFVFILKMMSQ